MKIILLCKHSQPWIHFSFYLKQILETLYKLLISSFIVFNLLHAMKIAKEAGNTNQPTNQQGICLRRFVFIAT